MLGQIIAGVSVMYDGPFGCCDDQLSCYYQTGAALATPTVIQENTFNIPSASSC